MYPLLGKKSEFYEEQHHPTWVSQSTGNLDDFIFSENKAIFDPDRFIDKGN
jgi:hypothetical protein